jgi:hypothetical protein
MRIVRSGIDRGRRDEKKRKYSRGMHWIQSKEPFSFFFFGGTGDLNAGPCTC